MSLSPRETEVLTRIAAGRTAKEIAADLGVAESTVEWHVSNILVKLDVTSRAAAVAVAIRDGVVKAEPPVRRARRSQHERLIAIDVLGLRLGEIRAVSRTRELVDADAEDNANAHDHARPHDDADHHDD